VKNQNTFLEDYKRHLIGDACVIYTLASQPTTDYRASFRDCKNESKNTHEIITSIKFFLDGRWQIAGPATTGRNIVFVSPNAKEITDIWHVGDYDNVRGGIKPGTRREVRFVHKGPGQWKERRQY